jgi:hypothetical protein
MFWLWCCVLFAATLSAWGDIDCSFKNDYPPQYVAYKVDQPPIIGTELPHAKSSSFLISFTDGKLDDPCWTEVAWTDPFRDIRGPNMSTPRFETRSKIRWDNEYLYVAGLLVEPNIW